MNEIQKLESAWAWARDTRLEVICNKRQHLAAPHNLFEARPGKEAEFERADQSIQALEVILGALEDAHVRARSDTVKRTALQLRDLTVIFGLSLLVTLGFAAACITLRAPDVIIRASAVIGIALSLAWAVKLTRK